MLIELLVTVIIPGNKAAPSYTVRNGMENVFVQNYTSIVDLSDFLAFFSLSSLLSVCLSVYFLSLSVIPAIPAA